MWLLGQFLWTLGLSLLKPSSISLSSLYHTNKLSTKKSYSKTTLLSNYCTLLGVFVSINFNKRNETPPPLSYSANYLISHAAKTIGTSTTLTNVPVLKLSCGSVFVFCVCVYVSMCSSRVVEPSGFRVLGFVGALGVFFQ